MKLLFLCTGNSCRSQMAEGLARAHVRVNADLTVYSAGIEAHGINPHAVAAMAECGIDISGQKSEIFAPELLSDGDLVVTVCDHARESCPVLPDTIRQLHWSFVDPAKAEGSEEEIAAVFRKVRDEINKKVKALVVSQSLSAQQLNEHHQTGESREIRTNYQPAKSP